MRARGMLLALMVASLLVTPFAAARAAGEDDTAESRIGAMLMVACGLSLKASRIAVVPWAGVAIVTCGFGLLDAALSDDGPGADPAPPPPPPATP